MAVDVKQLICFIAVAEEQSFSKAAVRLHLSQPPLSQRIRKLESDVGTTLLDRSTRRVQLTEAGRAFLGGARQLLVQLDDYVQTAQRIGRGEIGHIALGFVSSATSYVLPTLLKGFRKKYPSVSISLEEASPAKQVEDLHSGRLDAAIFYLPSPMFAPFGYSDLASHAIVEESLVVALPEGHPLSASRRVDLIDLANDPFVLVAAHRGPGLHDIVLEQCRLAGFLPKVVQEVQLIQTIGVLVASGIGVALVPASLRRLQQVGIDYRPIRGEPPIVTAGIVWRRDAMTQTLQMLLDTAQAVFPARPSLHISR